MPYIKEYLRAGIDGGSPPSDPGELNYAITRLLDDYVVAQGLDYSTIAEVLSACEGAKLEFYRRVAAPYEDRKIVANGDVYRSLK